MGTGGSTPGRPARFQGGRLPGRPEACRLLASSRSHALCRIASFVRDGQDALDDKRLFGTSGERHGGTVSGLFWAPAGAGTPLIRRSRRQDLQAMRAGAMGRRSLWSTGWTNMCRGHGSTIANARAVCFCCTRPTADPQILGERPLGPAHRWPPGVTPTASAGARSSRIVFGPTPRRTAISFFGRPAFWRIKISAMSITSSAPDHVEPGCCVTCDKPGSRSWRSVLPY